MKKLDAVEKARELMREGLEWSAWRWLTENGRLREAADRANESLEAADKKVKNSWSDDLKKAYADSLAEAALARNPKAAKQYERAKREAQDVDARVKQAAKRVREADEEALQATTDAEGMFAEAERLLSVSVAREAALKALDSYDLRERAIWKAEAAGRTQAAK
jgi:exonuclease VII small subunit